MKLRGGGGGGRQRDRSLTFGSGLNPFVYVLLLCFFVFSLWITNILYCVATVNHELCLIDLEQDSKLSSGTCCLTAEQPQQTSRLWTNILLSVIFGQCLSLTYQILQSWYWSLCRRTDVIFGRKEKYLFHLNQLQMEVGNNCSSGGRAGSLLRLTLTPHQPPPWT